jgi:spermidine synthase
VVQSDLSRLGRRVGFLLVANILGSVAGTLLTGWLALNVLGVAGTMKLLAFVSGAFAVAAAWGAASGISRPVLAAGAAGVVAATALFVPGAATLWARLHGTRIERIVFAEDATGLSVVRVESPTPPIGTMVFVNGLGQSAMPYGDIHTALGLLPAFIHPEPKNVAIIGLGSGDTVHAVAGRREIQNIVCIEIIGPQLVTLKELAARYPYAGLLNLLNDPRIDHVAADGRLALMRSAAQFDIIEADALRPNSAYSGNLYSDGYFALLRDRLRPNGLAVTWSPTVRVHNGFVRTFPHVVSFPGILVGSRQPVVVDREAVLRRLSEPPVREHYARAGIDVGHIVKTYLVEQWRYTPEFDRGTLTDFNTDLFPKDEFNRPAAAWHPPGAPGTR